MKQQNLSYQYRMVKYVMLKMGVRHDKNLYDAYEECQRGGCSSDDYFLQHIRDNDETYLFAKYMYVQMAHGDELADLVMTFPKSIAYSCFRQLQCHDRIRGMCLVFPAKKYKNWVLHNFGVRNAAAPSVELPSPWDDEKFSLCRLDDFIPLIGSLPYMLDPEFDNKLRPPYPDYGKINLEVCKLNLNS